MKSIGILVSLALTVLALVPAEAGDGVLEKLQDEVRALVARASPAIVRVTAERALTRAEFPGSVKDLPGLDLDALLAQSSSVATGFLMDRSGLILTTQRVGEAADRIRVDFPGGAIREGEVVGYDHYFQVGLVRVDPPEGVEPLLLSDEEAVPVGSLVVFVGNSFGGSPNLSLSIVSGSGKQAAPGEGAYDNFLVMNTPVMPGDAGGPFLDSRGRVVGMAVGLHGGSIQIVGSGGPGRFRLQSMTDMTGRGLAIPAADLAFAVEQIRDHGRVPASWMGVRVKAGTVEVGEIVPGSPAEVAGIQVGDVLMTLCGKPVTDSRQLLFRLLRAPVGRPAPITFLRGEERMERECVLEDALTALEEALPGIKVDPAGGIRISEATGVAAETGFAAGDLILAVNGIRVTSVAGVLRALRAGADGKITIVVGRDRKIVRVELPRS